jgi:heavy metal sensor kinase
MGRSIRWSLLLGHALLLVGVMGAFGGLLYLRVRDSTLGAVDAELKAQAQAVASSMESVGEGRFEVVLPAPQARYFQIVGFLVIRDRDGNIVDYSDPRFVELLSQADTRDVSVAGPGGTAIRVGRPIPQEQEKLSALLELILGIGALVFAVGLVGGWLLIGRLLTPIRRITDTAASISESNLSSRIDVAATEDELGDLARTLNSAFERLESAMNQLRQFTADASHELRTPVSVLMTQMELALRKPRSPEEYREVLETCLKAVRRMASMSEDLLFLSRADAKAVEMRREPLDLKEVVDEAVGSVRPLAEIRGIRMSLETSPQRLVGDRVRLGEAVTNLVTNAILYNRPEGQVKVTLRNGILAVADTGAGIPEEDRPRVFERFYRADKSRSRNAGGAGLGLAITKWIVETHGGTISFESRAGEGTTFRVRFPENGA